jgi:hypothetical protein
MQITVTIPDELASQLIPAGLDPSRIILEDALVQAYREDKISVSQLMEILGIESRYEFDGFLKAHQVWIEYTPQQMETDRRFEIDFVRTSVAADNFRVSEKVIDRIRREHSA